MGQAEMSGSTSTGFGGPTPGREVGTMLWFNAVKDLGALEMAQGERVGFPGTAFLPGEKPEGRCLGKPVEFETVEGAVARLAFVPETAPRRARRRRHH
ncbi:MAG TPA: hypothetical protein VFG85_05665 [Gaiellaceae bacterium]|jgi:hypothetical protein|nr:hypothetical protein [Gaiellaceae bacterium]